MTIRLTESGTVRATEVATNLRALESYVALSMTLVASMMHVTTNVTATLVSGSFTPPANSTLYYFYGYARNGQSNTLINPVVSDSLGSTITRLAESTPTHPFGATFYGTAWGMCVNSASTGATPAARVVTMDAFVDPGDHSDASCEFCYVMAVPATATRVRCEAYGANTTSSSNTLTASSTPSASNLSVYCFGAQPDIPFVAMDRPTGLDTTVYAPVPTTYITGGVFAKLGNTTAAQTVTNVGTSNSVNGGVIMEFAP